MAHRSGYRGVDPNRAQTQRGVFQGGYNPYRAGAAVAPGAFVGRSPYVGRGNTPGSPWQEWAKRFGNNPRVLLQGAQGAGTPSAAPQAPQRSLADRYLSSYDEAFQGANAANERRYQEILGGYDRFSNQEVADIRSRYTNVRAANQQKLVSAGLGNTTVGPSFDLGTARGESADINLAKDRTLQNRLGFMERRTDAFPDQRQMVDLMGQFGEGVGDGQGYGGFGRDRRGHAGGGAFYPVAPRRVERTQKTARAFRERIANRPSRLPNQRDRGTREEESPERRGRTAEDRQRIIDQLRARRLSRVAAGQGLYTADSGEYFNLSLSDLRVMARDGDTLALQELRRRGIG